jgi:hypothetical protein
MSVESTIKAIVVQAIKESQDRATEITKYYEKYEILDEINEKALFVVIAPANRFEPKPFYLVRCSYYGEFVGGIGKRNNPGKPHKNFDASEMKGDLRTFGDPRA